MNGRTGGDRTRDPNIKSVVLYQLSYSPRRSKTAHIIPKTDGLRNHQFCAERFLGASVNRTKRENKRTELIAAVVGRVIPNAPRRLEDKPPYLLR